MPNHDATYEAALMRERNRFRKEMIVADARVYELGLRLNEARMNSSPYRFRKVAPQKKLDAIKYMHSPAKPVDFNGQYKMSRLSPFIKDFIRNAFLVSTFSVFLTGVAFGTPALIVAGGAVLAVGAYKFARYSADMREMRALSKRLNK